MSKRKSAAYDFFEESSSHFKCLVLSEENNNEACGATFAKFKSGGMAVNLKRHLVR